MTTHNPPYTSRAYFSPGASIDKATYATLNIYNRTGFIVARATNEDAATMIVAALNAYEEPQDAKVVRQRAWSEIRTGLEKVLYAVDMLEGFVLSDEEEAAEFDRIKEVVQSIREAAHDCCIKPDAVEEPEEPETEEQP